MKRYFDQKRIKEDAPDSGDFNQSIIRLYIQLNKNFSITYSANSNPNEKTAEINNSYKSDALDFSIWDKRMTVEMYLEDTPNGIEWRWSRIMDGFTTKDKFRWLYYGGLHYKKDKNSPDWVKAPDWVDKTNNDGYYKPSRALMFKAKLSNDRKDPLHAFSLNIEIKQDNGKWLPITIDPDVRNPPVFPPD